MSILRNPWISLFARLIVGCVYAYASLDKIMHPDAFAKIVHNYNILPDAIVNIFALILPWLELTCGLALIMGAQVLGAATILSGLTAVFIVAVSINVERGVNIDCGCFSTSSHSRRMGLMLILEDAGLLILALHLMWRGPGMLSLDRPADPAPA